MKILFLSPYPHDSAGSQRFRFEQYFDALQQNNIQYQQIPFWEEKAWKVLYQKGKHLSKSFYLLKGLLKRFLILASIKKYDYVFIHRELFPVGPSFLISWYQKLNPKIIYDFDDAIWLPNFAANNKRFAFLKSYGQVPKICKKAYKLSVGNSYLGDFGKQYNTNIAYIPTTIDTEKHHKGTINYNFNPLVIGWTGTHSTMKYLPDILPVLDDLHLKYDFKLMVISDKAPVFNRAYLVYVPWNKASEIEDLKKIHVGLMPLHDDQWSRGKCGFKALQYMSIGMPALVSPVGVNTDIVDHQINGFICANKEDWNTHLTFILENPEKVKEIGENAQAKINSHYSVKAITPNFLQLFT